VFAFESSSSAAGSALIACSSPDSASAGSGSGFGSGSSSSTSASSGSKAGILRVSMLDSAHQRFTPLHGDSIRDVKVSPLATG
jgi:hypothetical protein